MKQLLFTFTLLFTLTSFAQVPNYVPTNGLVGWWGFNGNANDESGNGNNGTVNGATLTTDRLGNPNSAYDFVVNNVIDFGLSNDFSVTSAETKTITLWFQSATGKYPFLNKYENSVGSNSNFFIGGDAPAFSMSDGIIVTANGSNSLFWPVLPGNWFHVVAIYDGPNGIVDLFINGQYVTTAPLNYNNVSSSNPLIIQGTKMNSDYEDSDGKIDDIGFWNRALTQCEISELYHAQQFTPPVLALQDTLSACGASTTVDAGTDPAWASYLWNTTEDTQTISVSNSGLYTVEVTDTNGCIGYDTTLVSIIDPTITASDTVICIGDSVTLSVSNNTQALACSPLPSNLQNGLVGYWPFCGDANDESGNGNDGTVNGATLTSDRFGNSNSAYSFDGLDDNIQIGNSANYSFLLNSDYSVNFWFNISALPQGVYSFIGQGDEYAQYQNRFWRSYLNQNQLTNHIRGNLSDPGDTKNQIAFNNTGNWVMLSMFRSYNGTLKMYLNGLLVDTDTDITGLASPFTAPRNIILGAFLNAQSSQLMQFFQGKLDDIGIWNRTLSPSEIQQLYELGSYDITWSTGDTTSSITVQPTTTTTYSVTVSDGISSCVDAITVTVNDPQVNLGPDQDVCQGDSVLLDAGVGYDYYSWNTGDTTQTIYASQGGSYDATVGYETPVSNNYSMSFDGNDDYVGVSNVDINSNDFTWNTWVNLNPSAVDDYIIDNRVSTDVGGGFILFTSSFEAYYGYSEGGVPYWQANSGVILNPNTWYYISMVKSNDKLKIYLDGVFMDEISVPSIINYNAAHFIGTRHNNNNGHFLDGSLDNFEIWNTALSQEQIQHYMNCPPTGNEAGLVGYWNFEEGSGTTATDLTSNGNNGTLVNGPIWSTDVPNQVCVSCTASDTVVINELLPTTSSITESNCDSYTAPDGQTYTSTGNYTAVIPNAVGCDSTITIDLTITNSNTSSETATECDTYTWSTNGQTYTQSGQYTSVLTNQSGCDSTVTLDLTITNSNSSSETITECDTYTWNADGQTYTQSGQYTAVLTNAAGCDSTVTLDLTINNADNGINQLDDITLEATASNAQYQWVDCSENYQAISGATDQTFEATVNGDYACIVTENGCSDTTACITISKVGISAISNDGISVYPNPASSTLTIESQAVLNTSYRMIDAQGREVLQGKLQGTITAIDIENLAQGSYTLLFSQTELKIIKE